MPETDLKIAAASGLRDELPQIECFENQYPNFYVHEISVPEYASVCPKTGMPDFGTITILYIPDKLIMELKSLKLYFFAYRNLGIFYENLVNRVLQDLDDACKPHFIEVTCEITPRGGISSRLHRYHTRNHNAKEYLDQLVFKDSHR